MSNENSNADANFYSLSSLGMGKSMAGSRLVSFDSSPDKPLLMPLVTNIAQSVTQASSSALKRALPIAQRTAETIREFASKRPAPQPAQADIPPWMIKSERFSILEPVLREKILEISADESIFETSQPEPADATIETIDGSEMVPMARAALAADLRLAQLRFKVVPSRQTEATFWGCYFL